MTIEIKNCPFCDFDDVEVCEVEPGTFAISCPNCQCIGPFADDIENAARCWNIPHDRDYKMDRLVQEAKEPADNAEITGSPKASPG